MDLILWRHAEAEERRPGLPDECRRLTPKGEKQARKMAKWLKKRLPKGTRILVSPTERTRMTAHALGLPFELERKVGPNASTTAVLKAVGWAGGEGSLLVVGHQPTIGRLASRLLFNDETDWDVRKGGILWFSGSGERLLLSAAIGPNLI